MKEKIKSLSTYKKKAPKIPPFTCPKIDSIIEILERHKEREKIYSKKSLKTLIAKLEQLRQSNESLRESGIYWYECFKDVLNRIPKRKKKRRKY